MMVPVGLNVLFLTWKLNDGLGGRLTSGGPVASVIPRFSDVNDDDHHLKVQLDSVSDTS